VLLAAERRRAAVPIALSVAGIAACLVALKAYYGTALPLSFYVKSTALTSAPPEYLSIFYREKIKNAAQFGFLVAPLVAVALVGRERRPLLVAAGLFCAYHLFCTVEVMGHHSRFYLPALVPLAGAAMASWSPFLARARRRPVVTIALAATWVVAWLALKRLDEWSGVFIYIPLVEELPAVVALAALVGGSPLRPRAAALLAGVLVLLSAAARLPGKPVRGSLALLDDETILRRQIAPRATFRGLVPLVAIAPRGVYHTDMGAPGVLLPDAKVTDLDGILNEELTIGHVPFATLCARDRPDAIFLPNSAYPRLRDEILRAPCFAEYAPIAGTQLHIRRDRLADYERAAAAASQ
jgi:hypothetical protein